MPRSQQGTGLLCFVLHPSSRLGLWSVVYGVCNADCPEGMISKVEVMALLWLHTFLLLNANATCAVCLRGKIGLYSTES